MDITEPQKQRMLDKTKAPDERCIEWQGAKLPSGYGITRIGLKSQGTYKTALAHRVSYYVNNEDQPIDEFIICHKCDNPSCINPTHLFAGTHVDNVRDMDEKDRRVCVHLRGSENPNSKLSWDDILEIRGSKESCRKLANIYGVSKTQVSRIKRKLAWKEA